MAIRDALQNRSQVTGLFECGGDYYELAVENAFKKPWKAGQFAMISVHGAGDPFLKRPFSLYRETPPTKTCPRGELRFLIKEVGKGTKLYRHLAIGTPIDLIGPLGTGFEAPAKGSRAVLVGGGIGIPPLVALGNSETMQGTEITALIGGRSQDDLLALERFDAFSTDVRLATEDGSKGHRGRVTELLKTLIDEANEPLHVYACGPEGMLKAVGALAEEAGLPCSLSLEAHMGCGYGVCLGCVVEDRDGNFVRVCREGPVFPVEKLAEYGKTTKGDTP